MTARFRDGANFNLRGDALLDAIDAALHDIGVRRTYWTHDGRVTGSVPMSLWSWGEQITVTIEPDGYVEIESKCAFPLQLIDWGRNRRNCTRFLDALEDRLEMGDY